MCSLLAFSTLIPFSLLLLPIASISGHFYDDVGEKGTNQDGTRLSFGELGWLGSNFSLSLSSWDSHRLFAANLVCCHTHDTLWAAPCIHHRFASGLCCFLSSNPSQTDQIWWPRSCLLSYHSIVSKFTSCDLKPAKYLERICAPPVKAAAQQQQQQQQWLWWRPRRRFRSPNKSSREQNMVINDAQSGWHEPFVNKRSLRHRWDWLPVEKFQN